MDLRSKFRGALLGTTIGDSLGRRLEGAPTLGLGEVEEVVAGYSELRYTDDTQMMIGVAESLAERGGFDGEHMARRFVENYDPVRGYGPGSSWVIRAIERGEPWDAPARELFGGSGSYGNGSAMRVAPVGAFYHADLIELREVACGSSRITHTHELGTEGAALQACAVGLAVEANPAAGFSADNFLGELEGFVRNEVYAEKLGAVRELLYGAATKSNVVWRLGNGIEAFNSVPTAIYSFLSHPESFEEAVLYAVGLGGDADTIGAMTGAILGAYHGDASIPVVWMEKLEDCERIEGLADKLLDAYQSSRT